MCAVRQASCLAACSTARQWQGGRPAGRLGFAARGRGVLPAESMTASARAVVVFLLLASSPAFAGLGSLLAKAGKAGSSGAKVAKAAKVGAAGAKAAKLAKVGVGITGAVAAERAGFALAGLSDDAARSAAFLAKGEGGEVLMVTRAAGQSTHTPQSAAGAVDALAAEGRAPVVFLDRSAAASPELVAALPENAQLSLVEEGTAVPLRRAPGRTRDLLVDTVDGTLDLADYLGASGDEEEESSSAFFWVVLVGGGLAGFVVFKLARRGVRPSPA